MNNRQIWCADIETLKSCFTYTAKNIDTDEIVQYVLHKDRWDFEPLMQHLNEIKGHIGFNNVNFDYPIIHFIIQNRYNFDCMIDMRQTIIETIYTKVQQVINDDSPFGSQIKPKEVLIPQLDLYRLWHFNNKAKTQSLKGLEIHMKFSNVMDMPIGHDKANIQYDEIEEILDYNLNDVEATLEFYKRSIEKISLRRDLNKQYDLGAINYPDSKIGEELTLKLYCAETGLDYWETKKLRTERPEIALKDCIFDYIEFQTPQFKNLLKDFESRVIKGTKGTLEKSVVFNNFKYDYGAGGIHGCILPGIYESNDEWIIIDADVKCGVLTH